MSTVIEGFTCPICNIVVDEEMCEEHPDECMDLYLADQYCCGTDGSASITVFQWNKDFTATKVLCRMPSASEFDLAKAERICTTLTACQEISSESLSNGYIQTLQQLPLLIQDHLANPSPETEDRLRRQLHLLRARNRPDAVGDDN